MSLAPIILFVYNRPWHTELCLEALTRNVLADRSTLYIYCDGPKHNVTEEDFKKIKEVRQVIRKKEWCKEVIILERTKNLGLAESVIKGVSEVIEKHGNVIVLEDDIVTGKYFLKFMNEGLDLYQHEEKVFGISGYKYPSGKRISTSTYFLPIASSWSFGTWIDRWNKVNFNGIELLKIIDNKKFKLKLNFGGNPFYEMLKDQTIGKNDSWAIRFYVSMFLNNAYFLYPNKSMIENIGFDNSGVHCGLDDYYLKSKITHLEIKSKKTEVKLNRKIVINVSKSFNRKFNSNNKSAFLSKNPIWKLMRRIYLNLVKKRI